MMFKKQNLFLFVLFLFGAACTNDKKETKEETRILIAKGLYSFGPEVKTFTRCEDGKEYWVADSAKTLELAYHNLGFEKPYLPVYIEAEYHFIKSDTFAASAHYDSTMVVTKLLKISKEIPKGPCSP
ncbi:hypothetical protein WG904_06580 [Pedobacter sp. Du54]|uniref:hypothetical protein n=1 Tax=Pedobacter anseongensis TaxID=3133439 RepID=UPI00309829FA